MQIIGVDLHTRQQTVAMLNVETGEVIEKTLRHEGDSVREFYSTLPRPIRVGIEATGSMQWFLELMEELGPTGNCLVVTHSLYSRTANREPQLQSLYRHLEEQIEDLDRKVAELAWERPQARRLMTHPGVGPITALATESFLGEPKRMPSSRVQS
jgi:transposase